MNKSELVDRVAERTEVGRKDAEAAVEAVLSTIADALRDGDEVSLFKFGTFSVKSNAARTGRNPRTNEPVKIAASKSLKFKASGSWKELLNAKPAKKAAKAPAKAAAKAPAKAAAAKKRG